MCKGFTEYAAIGRKLAQLHVNYEQVQPYNLAEQWSVLAPKNPQQRYQVTKPTWVSRKDHTSLVYNEYLTLAGIPEEEAGYKLGGRSPLEWIIDRYKVSTDKASGIVNDPNDYCREIGKPDYIVDLIKRLVTVSLETQKLQKALPKLQTPATTGATRK